MTGEEGLRRRFFAHLTKLIIFTTLPVTALILWLMALIPLRDPYADILGLISISIGILGILVFYIFAYKYQITAGLSIRQRWFSLCFHSGISLLLFVFSVWLGFRSEWNSLDMWGTYNLNLACRVWVIGIIVIGSITLLGSLFDLMRNTPKKEVFPFGNRDRE